MGWHASRDTRCLTVQPIAEGLSYNLMESPAVSGAADDNALCITVKNEERRQAAQCTRQVYHQPKSSGLLLSGDRVMQKETMPKLQLQESMRDPGKCYMCGKPGHITRHCCNQEGSKSSGQKASKLGYSNQTHTHHAAQGRSEG